MNASNTQLETVNLTVTDGVGHRRAEPPRGAERLEPRSSAKICSPPCARWPRMRPSGPC